MPELVHLVRGFSIEYKVDPKGGGYCVWHRGHYQKKYVYPAVKAKG